MALKPPAPWEIIQQVSDLVSASGIKGEVDKSVRALAQTALTRLDVVSREEFDAQAEILKRTRARVVALEAELEEITRELEALAAGEGQTGKS
jgi:BMFP domain-containing protein YqiC